MVVGVTPVAVPASVADPELETSPLPVGTSIVVPVDGGGAVVIMVAQRVTSIKHAHQILVLEDGEAVGLGTHDELVANCPTYLEIVQSQLTADEAAA